MTNRIVCKGYQPICFRYYTNKLRGLRECGMCSLNRECKENTINRISRGH